jgi:sortase A
MTDTRSTIATPSSDHVPLGSAGMPAGPSHPSPISRVADQQRRDQADANRTYPGRRTIQIPDIPLRKLVGLSLVGVGGLIALFLAYLFVFTPLTGARNQQRLTQSLVGHPLTVFKLVDGISPSEGSAIGVLTIPALHLNQVIVQGTSAADLMNGPGLMPGSALPGASGNSVIAARRVTFGGPFGTIDSLKVGAKIRVVDGAGTFTYKVIHVHTVAAGVRDVVLPTKDNRITLVTANSTTLPNGRLYVQARLVGNAVAVPNHTVAVPSYDLGLSGDPVAGGLAAMWSIVTMFVLLASGIAVWRWRRPWLVYLFAAPVLLMCGLFACESVARALPATF